MKFNPYEFLNDNIENRPYNKEGVEDGSFHFIHRTRVFILIDKMQKRIDELKKKEHKTCPIYVDYKKYCSTYRKYERIEENE